VIIFSCFQHCSFLVNLNFGFFRWENTRDREANFIDLLDGNSQRAILKSKSAKFAQEIAYFPSEKNQNSGVKDGRYERQLIVMTTNMMTVPYKHGFVTDVETDTVPKGLTEETVEAISAKNHEPAWMLDFRINALRHWKSLKEPHPPGVRYPPIDYQEICYYSAPKKRPKLNDMSEVDPELIRTFDRLGIPLIEQQQLMNVAMDVVFDSASITTTFRKKLEEAGVILCPISEAIKAYPELVRKYLASVVPITDNFFAALNSAVFSDGSFAFVPKGVLCPMELSTYFRLNDRNAGQFERTLLIAEEGASVSYLEGCTAPAYDTNQLHAAVVEVIAHAGAHIKYSTVQNWYAGDRTTGKGGVFNFVTKRGLCEGRKAKISWTQVEAGAAITWKYPSCILKGDESCGEFYSVSLTNGCMQADTGTKMIHIGKNTSSTIISKSIATDCSSNTYRGRVVIHKSAEYARNYTRCDSLLIGHTCTTNTFPTIDTSHSTSQLEHEASTSRLSEEQLFYARSRGIPAEEATTLIISGFCGRVLEHLPLEFAQEAKNLLALKIERS
jgi:Fe-S cluster assembly protein SufB